MILGAFYVFVGIGVLSLFVSSVLEGVTVQNFISNEPNTFVGTSPPPISFIVAFLFTAGIFGGMAGVRIQRRRQLRFSGQFNAQAPLDPKLSKQPTYIDRVIFGIMPNGSDPEKVTSKK